ncbi:MAG TPA: sulfite exporter TauE/SafE family protein [Phototrophicaceae bacterium]|nr:sulfite exporter TauE/SafE family protein [Phototrophicaceae bacterium]
MTFAAAIIIAALLIGLSKGGIGGSIPGAFVTPLLSQILPTGQAVGIVLPMLMIGDLFALRAYWRRWDIRQIKLLLPMALVGIVMGSLFLIALADNRQDTLLRRIIGVFTLLLVIYKLVSGRLKGLHYQPRRWHAYLAGWASGFGSALANVGGPPFTTYMLLQEQTPETFIGTTTLFFAIVNMAKLPLALLNKNVLNLELIVSTLWILPLIPVSVWLGRRFVKWINPVWFERMMLVVLFIMALYLLFT